MTIYKAKGLEWDTVFVPGCNEGLIPCAAAGEQGEDSLLVQDVEAERRLFYVAVTRAKKTLHLYYSVEKPLSTFLSETEAEKVLEEVQGLKEILFNERSLYRQKDLYRFCRNISDFHLERYFSLWAEEFPGRGDNLGKVLVKNLDWKIIRAEQEYQKYREKLREYEEKIREHERRIKDLHTRVRREVIVVRKFKTAFFPVSPGDLLTFDLLKEEDVMVLSRQGLVGIVEFEHTPGIDKNLVAWEYCEAVTEAVSQTDGYIEAKFRSFLFAENHPIFSPPQISKPAELPPKVTQLLEPGFRKGLEVLKKLIG